MPNPKCTIVASRLLIAALVLSYALVFGADWPRQIQATGRFQPAGLPQQQPSRVDAGKGCIVDVRQTYAVEGTLSGSFDIDFRILVLGPCGRPLATFDEQWIALGRFVGSADGNPATANFTYTATVESGGEVGGSIVLGHGLDGELHIHGHFSDGWLSYDGQLTAPEQER